MSKLYDEVKKLVLITLRDKKTPEANQIKEHISVVLQMQRQLGRTEEVDEAALYREVLSQVNTWQAEPSVLRDRKHVNWLPECKTKIQWSFWKRYLQYLEEVKVRSLNVTASLDRITDSILGDIGNPAEHNQWDRRGMVVGEVQSGKTANYTGLICKAVDAGYKLIIVLAGMTNDLRSQTQTRLDAEFLGFESEVGRVHGNGSRIGVGLLDTPSQLIVHPLTYSSHGGDFRAKQATNLQLGGSPLLLVVKKNTSVLKRILAWTENQGKVHPETGKKIVDGVPLLLLDDEADNASVNTKKKDEDPTEINKAIRKILNVFQQRSYVGFTATPFANIFILPDEEDNLQYGDDLFPRSFIYSIAPPSNYVGPTQLFGLTEDLDGGDNATDGLPLIRYAEDAKVIFPLAHKKELKVRELPRSLIEAIKSFIINCAARRVRGQKEVHNSMLIHVTRYNFVQKDVMDLVNDELGNMLRMIEFNTGVQATHLIEQLEKMWVEDYLPTSKRVFQIFKDPQLIPLEWKDVRSELLNAITKIQVRGINGKVGGILDYGNYPNGLNVIAIGGDKLSRGLTLEDLSVSYYIRPAKNYDTLLQMGRWFGYRPGYVDLCRLYTTSDLVGWYEHITVANEELRREFNFMELSHLAPEDYGLRVRTHPNELNITAANKIRHGKNMQVTFSGHLSQTTIFHKKTKFHEKNFAFTDQWLLSLKQPETVEKNRVVWKDIPDSEIIGFLEVYKVHPMCRQAEGDLLVKYIQKLVGYGELTNWTVALISNSELTASQDKIGGHVIGLLHRTDKTPDDNSLYMLKKSNILSPDDQQIDLTDVQKKQALDETIKAWKKNKNKSRSKNQPKKPTGPHIRCAREPKKGLILLYPLDPKKTGGIPFTSTPIIGFAISFSQSKQGNASAIAYKVNTKYWRDRYGEEDDDDDET